MGTIDSNPLDHSVNYNVTGNYNINPLDVGIGGWQPNFIRQGWQCPCCGRVYSPDTTMCLYCGNYDIKTTTGTTITREENDSNANIFKSDNGYDDMFVKRVTYSDNIDATLNKNMADVAKLFLPLRAPKKVMSEMGYEYNEDITLENNCRNFLQTMEKEGKLNELYGLLILGDYK